MVAGDAPELRDHEQLALELYEAEHRDDGVLRARQALVLGVFLVGDYRSALELEQQNLEVYRRNGAEYLVADNMVLQAAMYWRLGEPAMSWLRLSDGLRYFRDNDNTSEMGEPSAWRRSSSCPTGCRAGRRPQALRIAWNGRRE